MCLCRVVVGGNQKILSFGTKAHDVIDFHNLSASDDAEPFLNRKRFESNCNIDLWGRKAINTQNIEFNT